MLRYLWNSSLVFLFLGAVFGIVIAWGALFEGGTAVTNVIDVVRQISWGEYILTFMTTFVAAAVATLLVFAIEWWREKNNLWAEISAARTILMIHMDHLLTFKRRHVLVNLGEMKEARGLMVEIQSILAAQDENRLSIALGKLMGVGKAHMSVLFYSGTKHHVPVEHISKHAAEYGETFKFLIWASDSVLALESLISTRNNILDEIRSSAASNERRLEQFYGVSTFGGGQDNRFFSTTEQLHLLVDDALYLVYETILRLERLAQDVLPSEMAKKFSHYEIIGDWKNFMPDYDAYTKKYSPAV